MTDNETINVQSLLQYDLVKLCKQIGIRNDEIPKLEFNKFKMLNLLNSLEEYFPQSGFGRAYQRELDSCKGLCSRELKTIYVEHNEDRHKKRSYEDLYVTLAHELVHYRFYKETKYGKTKYHNKGFYHLLDSILKGEVYPEVRLYPE